MKYIKEDGALIIKSWCDEPEDGAIEQAKHLAKLPFAFRQVCLMPDTHQGYGMPIGGVLATKDVIVPNAIGVDIGCGMCALKTILTDIDTISLQKIVNLIKLKIPVGMNHHEKNQDKKYLPNIELSSESLIVVRELNKISKQIGTLGGGNHFIEIQKGNDGYIWIMLHSGSRNLGKQVADFYNKAAIQINELFYSRVPKEWDLAFLPLTENEAQDYLEELDYCIEFAICNRLLMMERIKESFAEIIPDVKFETIIHAVHNYARMENHFGENVLIHRKGAISARYGELGIIPGSQGTNSYIVKGLGNPDSFTSCSHGAGRKMGRKEAQKNLNLKEEIEKLDNLNILHAIKTVEDLDEASGAYKPIDIVMKEQQDLVAPIVELKPLAVIKG